MSKTNFNVNDLPVSSKDTEAIADALLIVNEAPEDIPKEKVKVSSDLTLCDLDETDLLNPLIEAHDFYMQNMLEVKSSDPEYVLRWVNWKCGEGSNVLMMKSMGFEYATTEHIIGGREAITGDAVSADGYIKTYDVVLMRIKKTKLFPKLKANLLSSLNAVQNYKSRAAGSALSLVDAAVPGALRQAAQAGKIVAFS